MMSSATRTEADTTHNKLVYSQWKKEHKPQSGNWVIVANGEIIINSESQQEVMKALYETDRTNCYLVRVDHEDVVEEISSVYVLTTTSR